MEGTLTNEDFLCQCKCLLQMGNFHSVFKASPVCSFLKAIKPKINRSKRHILVWYIFLPFTVHACLIHTEAHGFWNVLLFSLPPNFSTCLHKCESFHAQLQGCVIIPSPTTPQLKPSLLSSKPFIGAP